ncbi:MAG TPA: DUF4173 domain-containing protein [Gemmatimonadales bacterium]
MPRARAALITAIALGLLGDQLFRARLWGLNVAIWLSAIAAAALLLAPPEPRRNVWPWLGASFFAAMWAVRDAPLLLAVDLVAALSLLCLPSAQAVGLRVAGVVELGAAHLRAGWRGVTGAVALARALGRPAPLLAPATKRAAAVGVGLLLGVPPVLVFGSLFASADPVFAAALSSLLDTGLQPLVSHTALAGALAWISAGYVWRQADRRDATPARLSAPPVGQVPVLTALSATVLVFTLFLAAQAGSLFGGEAFVREQTGLTYAEYARRGFFELVFASALSLPVVYVSFFAAGPATDRGAGSLHALMTVQLALTALVLASALWRMGLYMRVYGLTEDRLYGALVMLWIGATIVVFALTVLRARPAGAAFGSIVCAAAALAILNLANPRAVITRYNLAHPGGRPTDVALLARLGGDVVPVVVAQFDRIDPDGRCWLARQLLTRRGAARGDWRGWNLARWRGWKAAQELTAFRNACVLESSVSSPGPPADS